MHFRFTDDQRLFQEAARDLLAKECPPEVVRAAWSNADGRSGGAWAKLAEAGIVGMLASEGQGGLGMTMTELVLILEEAGKAALPEPVVATAAVAVPLLAEASEDSWLARLVSGEVVAACGLDDAPFVAGAAAAEVLLLARDSAVWAVSREAATLNEETSVDRSRRLASVSWSTADATRVGDASTLALARDRGAVGAAAVLVGLADRMIAMAVEYAKVRKQFGRAIGSFQAVQHQLVDALRALEFARPPVYRAAWTLSQSGDAAPTDSDRALHASMAKAYASDAAMRASRAALQVHGAIGYTTEYDLHLWMKRAWALASAWGDARTHRARVADRVLGAAPTPS